MRPILLAACLLLIPGAWTPLDSRAASGRNADQQLQEADAVRSTDPSRFAGMLEELERREATLDPGQRRYLRLLQAYRLGYGGQYSAAIDLATAIFEEAPTGPIKFRAGLLAANSAATTRDFSVALKFLEDTLALDRSGIPDELDGQAQLVAGIVYAQLGQYEKALEYSNAVIASDSTPRNLCVANQLKFESLAHLDSARRNDAPQIRAAIAGCESIGEAIGSNLLRINLAREVAAREGLEQAIRMLESHAAEVEATRYPRLVSEYYAALAGYLLSKGDIVSAERHALLALEASHNNAQSLPRATAFKVLYEVALRRQDTAKALEHYRDYAEADKAYLDDIKTRELAVQQSRNEAQQKDQAIALLSKQNEVLKLEQEVATASAQNTRLVILLLGIVLAAIGYWAYKIKRMQVAFRRLAQIDGLTGLCNRRHFHAEAEALLGRCAASGKDAALVLLDLDHFKHINDRHGHATGDRVLKQVAEACQAACRDGDLCGRLGGEEFGILSSGGDIEAARRIAEACRQRLAAIDIASFGHDQPVTASFGCTTASCSGYDFEAMFSEADAAMYRAKHGGRDRIEVRAAAADSSVHEPRIAASHG